MRDGYIANADTYCANCAPDGAENVGDLGESDTPQHCSTCGVPLVHSLTTAGVDYVLEAIAEALEESPESRNRIMPLPGSAEETMTYWHGSRHVEIVRGWAEVIRCYCLNEQQRTEVEHFLEVTAA